MGIARSTRVAVLALVLAAGCMADDLHVGMVPARQISPPPGQERSPNYFGTFFGTHWSVLGVEISANTMWEFELAELGEWSGEWQPEKNFVTAEVTLWLGWLMTYQHFASDKKAWLVFRPSAGVYTWSEAPESFGGITGLRVGALVHLNEYDSFGIEYGVSRLHGTHGVDAEYTETQGMYYTYTVKF